MMTTDLALLGRLGDQVVAAAALSHTVLFAAFTLGMGLMSAVAPLASQAFGARNPRFVRRSVRVGLWAAVLAGVPLTALQFWGEDILLALGQSPELGRTGRTLSLGPELVSHPGLDLHGAAQLHECGEPARAGAVDHARGHSDQRRSRLRSDLWRVRRAAARRAGCGSGNDSGQRVHVRGRDLDRLHAPPVQEVPRPRPLLALRLAALPAAPCHRSADLGLLSAGIRSVCCCGALDGQHLYQRHCCTSDRAADSGRSSTWCRSASPWPPLCVWARPLAAATAEPRDAPVSRP